MTSSRTEYPDSQARNNDQQNSEQAYELKLFRDRKTLPPAEADGFMLSQDALSSEGLRAWAARSEVERQPKKAGDLRSTPSGSGVAAVTADICGESDLTAEHHGGEESSSNYHGHESSLLESGAESSAAMLNNQFRSQTAAVPGKQRFMSDSANGGSLIRPLSVAAGDHEAVLASHTSRLPISRHSTESIVDRGMSEMVGNGNSFFHTVEPAAKAPSNPLASCSTAQQSSVTSSSSDSAHGRDWLQLSVGPSLNGAPKLNGPDSDVDCEAHLRVCSGRNNSFGDENTMSPIGISASAHTRGNLVSDRSNLESTKPVQWHGDLQHNSIPSSNSCSVPPKTLINSETLQILPTSTCTAAQNEDRCFETIPMFPSGAAHNHFCDTHPSTNAAGPAVKFLSRTSSGLTARLCTEDLRPAEPMISLGSKQSSPPHGRVSELRSSLMLLEGGRKELSDVGQFGSQYRDGSTEFSILKPVADGQFRAAGGMDRIATTDRRSVVQFQRDDRQHNSRSDWIQTPGKLPHNMDARHAWLSGSSSQYGRPTCAAFESVGQQQFIPLSNALEDGSTTTSTDMNRLRDGAFRSGEVYHGDRNNARSSTVFDTQQQQQHQHQTVMSSDDWERLRQKVSPSMVFQSRGHQFQEGTSTPALHHLVRYNSNNIELASMSSDEKVSALKVALENIHGNPQLQPLEASNLIKPVTGWSFSRESDHPVVRVDSRPESLTSPEHEVIPAFLSKRVQLQHSGHDHQSDLVDQNNNSSTQRQSWQQTPVLGHNANLDFQQGYWNALQGMPSAPTLVPAKRPMLLSQPVPIGPKDAHHAGLWFILRSGETQDEERALPQISKAYLRIKDGKTPVSAVKKYLVNKLGLSSEAEVEITCKGQLVVPSLPLQQVRDAIWFSNRNGTDVDSHHNGTLPVSGDASESPSQLPDQSNTESHQQFKPQLGENGDGGGLISPTNGTTEIVSKDILMVLTYRRHHPGAVQLSNFLT